MGSLSRGTRFCGSAEAARGSLRPRVSFGARRIAVRPGIVEYIFKKDPFSVQHEAGSSLKGLVVMPEGPVLVAARPVLKSDDSGPARHPEKGYRIALSSPDLAGVADLILKHHERWDGSGYPLGLKGEEIPVECRILSIVDAFDAMTSERPYRKPKSKEGAIIELKRCTGSQFDPQLVDIFVSMFSAA